MQIFIQTRTKTIDLSKVRYLDTGRHGVTVHFSTGKPLCLPISEAEQLFASIVGLSSGANAPIRAHGCPQIHK